jgi:DNA-binding LacI/PurR family transcriptional regulator
MAHISGWQGSQTGRERQQGFIEALRDYDLAPVACIDSHFKRDRAIEATLALFDAPHPPDAIFAGNDHMAFAVLETLRCRMNLDVPGDVSLVGFDDVGMAAWQIFDLTTVRQPARRMVDVTVRVLLDAIEHGAQPDSSVQIDSHLVVRGTARLPDGVTRTQPLPTHSPNPSGS